MEQVLSQTVKIVKQAGKEVLKFYGSKDLDVDLKLDKTLVTEVDLAANDFLIKYLKKFSYPILSEEKKDNLTRLNSDRIWIIDPLDGTNDFIKKTGDFSIMVALVEKQKPILGIVYLPVSDILYFAEKQQGAYKQEKSSNAKKISVSSVKELSQVRIVASRSHFSKEISDFAKKIKTKEIKRAGSNGIKIGLIAEGKAELFFNPTNKMGEWDSCAAEIILEEAGGKLTDIGNNEIIYNKKHPKLNKGLFVSNGVIHEELNRIYHASNFLGY